MIKTSKLLIPLLLASVGSLQAQQQTLSLKGTVKNGNATVVYLQRFENKIFTVIDSAQVKKGAFAFRKQLPLPDLYGISTERDGVPSYVFLDVGDIKVTIDAKDDNRQLVSLSGSKSQELFDEYRAQRKPDIRSFIQKYPDNIVSSYLLYREWSYRLSPEELEAHIALLSGSQQQSRYIQDLRKIIAVARQVAIGKKAPAIVANDPDGNPQALYDHLGKYTLIDFWASWCPPCRKENPNIVANYQKYKSQGFKIYAISLDKKKEAWLKGIADDHLTWQHVSELNYWNSEIAAAYAVRAIPANFLVDDKGTIIAKNVRGEELGKVLDSLFNQGKTEIGGLKKDFKGQNPISYESTQSQAISQQERGTFTVDQRVFFSNDYDGARLNGLTKSSEGVYHLQVVPERTPINPSPWYGFQVWSARDTTIKIQLDYPSGVRHRYDPKVSTDGTNWNKLSGASFDLPISSKRTWISAQANIPSSAVYSWIEQVSPAVQLEKKEVGKTALGKPVNVYVAGNPQSKKTIAVLGRQHPPEITGHYAYASFVEYLLGNSEDAKRFREKYRIYLIPIVNPDGVDLGHWRTNANGVDLNRDWAEFNQPETIALRDYFKQEIEKQGRELYFAIDFHSTGSDIYYTVDPALPSRFPGFVSNWISTVKQAIPGYEPLVKPLYLGGPTFTAYSYLYKTYHAEALVYEIGDNTDADFIQRKARISAQKLIEKLNES
ncbi:redoxin domain-containing protein [Sphingobacterium paramultivorum]|uniref:Redoxin domain-containing protein n=1 Tax=Sphingobacterium paramultivorum TaxID=2886510 RepID=A0A7G5E1I8_9SPHI|nr:thioredoxin-like domain-containing protein [Sphingobacterium paramultivorum]QMV67863.1 redoxin domain-containing protein [Sphingobacterium paramultivorum]WSO16758.1 thioredoxin-like domain-containing protein [Sphingobacterium paramultivorum]